MIDIRLAKQESVKNNYEKDRHAEALKFIENHFDEKITEAVYYGKTKTWIAINKYPSGIKHFIKRSDVIEVVEKYEKQGFIISSGSDSYWAWDGTINW